MAQIQVRINRRSIEAKLQKAIEAKGGQAAYTKAYNLFRRAKNMMLRDFDRHPITAELKAGPNAVNFSDTLGGYGNLFSFLGFNSSEDPTGPLKDLIDIGTNFRATTYRNNAWYFRIQTPSKEAIESITPMEWESGNSWAYAVEEGVSNLSYYMYKRTSASRSKTGFQAGWEINEDLSFEKKPYLTEIFGNFRDRINNSSINDA